MCWDWEKLKDQLGLLRGWGRALGGQQSLAGWLGGDALRVPTFPVPAGTGSFEVSLV